MLHSLYLALLLAPTPAGALPPIEVAVSVPPQAYLVERVGGQRVEVTAVMVPSGAAPETYCPSPRQVLAASRAALYVKVGHPHFLFERRTIDPLLGGRPELRIVDLWESTAEGEATPSPAGHAHHHGGTGDDPHLWVAPAPMAAAARKLAYALAEMDPAFAGYYLDHLRAFEAEIQELDRDLGRLLAPGRGQAFLVDHPAWGHLARQYGLDQVAIEAEHKPPSPARLIRLMEEARQRGFTIVFVQRGFPIRSAQVVAREIGARLVPLDPLARDWSANLRATAEALRGGLRDG